MIDIEGYEGLYKISPLGFVWSVKRRVEHRGRWVTRGGRWLKNTPNNQGYEHVSLYKEGSRTTFKVHRLVAKYFLKGDLAKEVNHIDLDKSNNHVSNLELVTAKENTHHFLSKGSRRNIKLNEESAIEIFKSNKTVKELAQEYGVSGSSIRRIRNGQAWSQVTSHKVKGDSNG